MFQKDLLFVFRVQKALSKKHVGLDFLQFGVPRQKLNEVCLHPRQETVMGFIRSLDGPIKRLLKVLIALFQLRRTPRTTYGCYQGSNSINAIHLELLWRYTRHFAKCRAFYHQSCSRCQLIQVCTWPHTS